MDSMLLWFFFKLVFFRKMKVSRQIKGSNPKQNVVGTELITQEFDISQIEQLMYINPRNPNRIATYEILSRLVSVMNNFINEQKDLFQVMANLNHIPNLPVIIKPATLLLRLAEIGSLLPLDVALPVTPALNQIYWYYQQTMVNTLLIENTLMMQLNMPIIELSELSVFYLFSLPISKLSTQLSKSLNWNQK